MRYYSITNMYMNGIHSGIQTQHSTVELFVKYQDVSFQKKMLFDWAINHKTTIVLNGGMHDSLSDFLKLLKLWESDNQYDSLPFCEFREPGVNNALTSIGIVIPEDAIKFMDDIRSTKSDTEEYKELQNKIFIEFGRHAIPVFEIMAFMPLAK